MPYKDKDRQREFQRKAAKARTDLIRKMKNAPCVDCGGRFPPECMDFDHTEDNKSFNIARSRTAAINSLLEEINKCELICANCHRIRTRKRRDMVDLD